MYNKIYWKELMKKMTLFEWIIVGFSMLLVTFFSIFDLDKNYKLILSNNWTFNWMTCLGQFLIFWAGFFGALTVMNRIHRFKQEMPVLLIGALLTGFGLVLQGYGHWKEDPIKKGADLMGPGIVQILVFGLSSLGAIGKFRYEEKNVIPAKKHFFSRELLIGIFIILLSILPFYTMFDKFAANNKQISGDTMNLIAWIGLLSFSFSSAAIVVMTIFRWTWTFLFWTIANVLFVVYYLKIGSLPMTFICSMFTFVDIYIFFIWSKEQKIN